MYILLPWSTTSIGFVNPVGSKILIGFMLFWVMNGTTLVNTVSIATGIPSAWKIVWTPDLTASGSPGILWLHGYGNVFEKRLDAGEQIDIEPGGWLWKDPSVQMSTNMQNLSTGFFGSMSFTTNRFTGPGRVAIQSMYLHLPSGE